MLETQEALEELRRRWEAQPLAEVGAGGDVYCFYSFPWHSMSSLRRAGFHHRIFFGPEDCTTYQQEMD